MVLVYDLTPSKVAKVANRIRERIANTRFQLDGFPAISITASVGIAHGKHVAAQRMNILADEALYAAKEQGRNRVILYEVDAEAAMTTQDREPVRS